MKIRIVYLPCAIVGSMAAGHVLNKLALYGRLVLNSYLETVLPFQFVVYKVILDKTNKITKIIIFKLLKKKKKKN